MQAQAGQLIMKTLAQRARRGDEIVTGQVRQIHPCLARAAVTGWQRHDDVFTRQALEAQARRAATGRAQQSDIDLAFFQPLDLLLRRRFAQGQLHGR